MQIDKAIEILTIWKKENCPPPLADEFNALQLGIEALILYDHCKRAGCDIVEGLLPGETER